MPVAATSFGDIDRADFGLTPLATEERAGFVWVVLTPGLGSDLDGWLGEFEAELATLGLAGWHVHEQRELEGPGWKVTFDGYLEGYHRQALHPETVGKDTIANLMVADTFGPHQRIVFGRKNLGELAGRHRRGSSHRAGVLGPGPARGARRGLHGRVRDPARAGVGREHAVRLRRNEPTLQHYHRWVARLAGDG